MQKVFFKLWLEDEQSKFEFYKDLILGKLNSKKKKFDLSTSLNMWKPAENLIDMLQSLGEYKNLDDDIQERIEDKITSGNGTLEDIVRLMAKESEK